MKKYFRLPALLALCVGLTLTAQAQVQRGPMMGGMQRGPGLSGALGRLFGDNQAFTATLEMTATDTATGSSMMVPMKLAFDSGKSRIEMNTSQSMGSRSSPIANQMKAMGMDIRVMVSRPDKKATYTIFPGMKAYAEVAIPAADAAAATAEYKTETAELGKDTVDGHPCVKNKVTVTSDKGAKHEYITWNATDLKNFPVKIESADMGQPNTLLFKDVSFAKPAADIFEAPAGFTKYDSEQAMMQAEMMKRARGGGQ